MLSVWPWLMLAALLILPVILRLYAGDEPRNEITHESGEEEPGSEEERPGPGILPLAA